MSQNNQSKVIILSIVSVAFILLSFVMWNGIGQTEVQAASDQINNDSLGDNEDAIDHDAELVAEDEKEKKAVASALSDPKVSKYTDHALSIDHQFYPSGDGVEDLILHVAGKEKVVGDWQTGQTVIYSKHEIKAKFTKGKISSVGVTPLPDKTYSIVFSEDEKEIISTVMQDARVQELLKGRNPIYVMAIYSGTALLNPDANCPPESCEIVKIVQVNTKKVINVWVNPSADHIANIVPSEGW